MDDREEKEDAFADATSDDAPRNRRTLAVLDEIIRLNGLEESTSIYDGDDGDGRLEARELGRQQWSAGELVALDLSSRHAYGIRTLPDSLGDLSALRYLDLEGNALEQLPWSIGGLEALETLNLRRNRLRALPESLGDLGSLAELDAGENHLSELPESLGDLVSLRALWLGNNPYRRLPDSIARLARLELLDVGQHYEPARPRARDYLFSGIIALPSDLGRLPSLSLLSIEGTRFDCVGEGPAYLSDGSIENVVRSSSRPCDGQALADRFG